MHDARLSLGRARFHLDDLGRQVRTFLDTKPYRLVVDHDVERRKDVYKLVGPSLPDQFALVAFDMVSNLRAALDRAAFATARVQYPESSQAHFPFGVGLHDYKRVRGPKGTSRDIPEEVFQVMLSLAPHKGGNVALWAMNEMCNTNKHAILVPLAHGMNTLLQMRGTQWPRGLEVHKPIWDSAKNEAIWAVVDHGVSPQHDVQIQIVVATSEIGPIASKPAGPFFNAMCSEVERALVAIEGEARRIGLPGFV